MNAQEHNGWADWPTWKCRHASKPTADWTLAEYAESAADIFGIHVPPRDTPEWRAMYESWTEWAFTDLRIGTASPRRAQDVPWTYTPDSQ